MMMMMMMILSVPALLVSSSIETGLKRATTSFVTAASCALLLLGGNIIDPSASLAIATEGGPGYSYEVPPGSGVVRLKQCSATSNCVSSNYLEPPNRYISPLKIVNDRDVAFQRAVRELQKQSQNQNQNVNLGISIVEVASKEYYIHLSTPGTAPGSLDDIELTFPETNSGGIGKETGIVNVRCEARVTLPPPPFCVKKNCINGNMDQRKRLEDLSYILGLPPANQKQMQEGAKWTPIFFNSDKVPGFYDDY